MVLVLLAVPLHVEKMVAVVHDVAVGVMTATNPPLADGGFAVLLFDLFHG